MPTIELRGLPALEAWGRKVTSGYRGVCVHDLSSSWRDGLAFCAIIHHFRPDLIDFDSLSKENILFNNNLAFTIGEQKLGIPALLDPEDMLLAEPDRSSIALYLSEVYECFEGSKSQIEGSQLSLIEATRMVLDLLLRMVQAEARQQHRQVQLVQRHFRLNRSSFKALDLVTNREVLGHRDSRVSRIDEKERMIYRYQQRF